MFHANGQRQQVKLCSWSPLMFSESPTFELRKINYLKYNIFLILIYEEPILLTYLFATDEIIFSEESQVA